MLEALQMADEVLLHGVQGITDLITTPGLINRDFADVRTIMANAGSSLMGIGTARGENRAVEAAAGVIDRGRSRRGARTSSTTTRSLGLFAFTHTRGDVELYEEQLARWRRAALSPVQHREIDRLADELYRLRQVVDAILAIAEELKRATVERTVEKSDLERGLELYVLGGPPDRSPLEPDV